LPGHVAQQIGAQAVGDRLQRQVSVHLEDEDGAADLVGERIRAQVAEALFGDDPDERGVNIPLSVGVATFPDNAADAATNLGRLVEP
jgi:GGDEF domain-containing protein